ncbi:hypothetical protein D018_4662A, partial [Vibrio parahaemolyticus VP2007-007]
MNKIGKLANTMIAN